MKLFTKYRLVFFAASILLLINCHTISDWPNRVKTGKYLFEIEYTSNPWRGDQKGYYVDDMGKMHSYVITRLLRAGTVLSSEELDRKYSQDREFIKQIDIRKVREMSELIELAGQGSISRSVNRAHDINQVTYKGYLFDGKTKWYSPVMLKSFGQIVVLNDSPEAEFLVDWLDTIK